MIRSPGSNPTGWQREVQRAQTPYTVRRTQADALLVPRELCVLETSSVALRATLPPAASCPGDDVIVCRTGAYPARVFPNGNDRDRELGGGYGSCTVHTSERFISDGAQWWPETETPGWDDVQGSALQGTGAASLSQDNYRDTAFQHLCLRHDQDDAISFTYQMSHTWDGGPIKPHIHVIPLAAGSGTVRFDGYYHFGNPKSALPALASWTTFTVDTAFLAGDQYTRTIIPIGQVSPPAYPRGSAMFSLYIRRPGSSSASDTYATNKGGGTTTQANVALEYVDVHYRRGSSGTVEEY